MKYFTRIIRRGFLPVLLTITSVASLSGMEHLDGVVAVVGDSAILMSELDAFSYLKLSQAGQDPDSLDTLAINILRNQSLQELIDGKVLLVQAEKDSTIIISDYEIENELTARISMILQQNRLSMADFEAALKEQQGLSLNKFKSELRKQIRHEVIRQKVQQQYVMGASLTKKEVSAFYEEFKDSLPVNGKSILLSTITRQITPPAAVRQDAFTRIGAIKARLDKGEDFIALAQQFSQDPNAATGGELGFIRKGSLSEIAFEDRAFTLGLGEISEPFETRLGFHIITVTDKRDQEVFVRQIFLPVIAPQSEIDRTLGLLDSIRTAVTTHNDFIDAVRQFSDDDVSRSRSGQLKWQVISNLDPAILKAVDSLAIGAVSAPIHQNMSAAIYRVDDRRESRPLTLEDDWSEIAEIAQRVSVQKKLLSIVQKWRKKTYIDIRL